MKDTTALPDVVVAPGMTTIDSSSMGSNPPYSRFIRSKFTFKEIASSKPRLSMRTRIVYGSFTIGIFGSVVVEPGKNLNTGSDGRSRIS